jgi:hypothetical protein
MTTAAPSIAFATIQPAFTDPERLALAGYLAGYSGLTREAYALDLPIGSQGGSERCEAGGAGPRADGCEQAEGASGLYGVGPAVGAELGVQVPDMGPDGVGGD